MNREWKPGDIASIIPHRFQAAQRVAIRDGDGWTDEEGARWSDEAVLARPLVVIDPEGPELNRLVSILGTHFRGSMNEMREAFRAMVNPPKPEEPQGLGAVVEDTDGEKWMRFTHNSGGWPWIHAGPMDSRKYADIAVIRVLSEGVVA